VSSGGAGGQIVLWRDEGGVEALRRCKFTEEALRRCEFTAIMPKQRGEKGGSGGPGALPLGEGKVGGGGGDAHAVGGGRILSAAAMSLMALAA
jgi:hypothetical protein